MKHHDKTEDSLKTNNIESESKKDTDVNGDKKMSDCREKDIEIKNWEEEYNQLYDKYLMLYSDFDNFRKRTNKEKLDLIDSANESLILDVLPVLDDFERAVDSMKDSGNAESVLTGFKLIYNKFQKVLNDKGLKEIVCIEEPFNADLHDAIARIPTLKKKFRGRIVDQVQKGYYLKNKVIRHSKVVVGE
jgi:molecular chaperone GrpE